MLRWGYVSLLFMCMTLRVDASEPLDIRVGIDVRAVSSNSDDSFVNGGDARTRFDSDHDGLRLGAAYLTARYRLSDTLTLHGDFMGFADGNSAALDVTQLYLQFRPFPQSAIRWSSRVGMFYPEFSMENRGPAWTPVYTLTPSAINSWFGEELRALGAETELRWLGSSVGYQGDIALIGGVYGWNDPLGTTVALHGWDLHDRQTGFTGYLVWPGKRYQHIREFRDIDGRPGFYAGIDWRHGDHFELRAYRYDNRADPAAFNQVYAWLTRFDVVGARWEVNDHWTVVGQVLRGETLTGPQQTWGAAWDMNAWFVLLSREWNAWRLSLRRDQFSNDQYRGLGSPHLYDDHGNAWTLSLSRRLAANWQLTGEWLQVNSTFAPRTSDYYPALQHDQQLQLALQYRWHH